MPVITGKAQGGKFGARDIRRVIRKEVEDKIAEIIVDNRDVKSVYAYEENGDIKVKFE